MTLNELQQNKFSDLNWRNYLKMLYPEYQWKDSDEVNFSNYNYLERIIELLAVTPKRIQANYVSWCFFMKYFEGISSPRINEIKSYYYREVTGESLETYQIIKKCAMRVMYDNDLIMNAFYMIKHFDAKKKDFALEIGENIRTSLRKIIYQVFKCIESILDGSCILSNLRISGKFFTMKAVLKFDSC